MTGTNFMLLIIVLSITLSTTINLYKKFKLKKKVKWNNQAYYIFIIIYFLLLWKGNYYSSAAQFMRETDNIPKIDSTMYLKYRSRFKEYWFNTDTASIKHATKVIKLGQTIEKEIDFFTNSKEFKTLVVENKFPYLSNSVKKEYYLMNILVTDNDFAKRLIDRKILTEIQKDSVLNSWQLDY